MGIISFLDRVRQRVCVGKTSTNESAVLPLNADGSKVKVDAVVSFDPELHQVRAELEISDPLPLDSRHYVELDLQGHTDGWVEGIRIAHIDGDLQYDEWEVRIWTKDLDWALNPVDDPTEMEYRLLYLENVTGYTNYVPVGKIPFLNEDDPQADKLYVEITPTSMTGGAGAADTFIIKLIGE